MTCLTHELQAFIGAEIVVRDEPIGPDTDLLLSGLVDSLGVTAVVDWLEERLEIEIDPTDVLLENFRSVEAIVDYVAGRGVPVGER